MKQRHKLLERQLKRFFDKADVLPKEMQAFIEAVNDAYSQADKDRFMLERALELSSWELMQANSEMRATLESTADGILVVDARGKIVSFNQKFVEMWGIPDDILASRDADKAIAFVLDKFSNPDSFLKKVREIYTQPEIETFDILKLKNGRVFERYSLPQKLGNTCVGRVWSFHDITKSHLIEQEQELLKQFYEHILDQLPIQVTVLDSKFRYLYVNPSCVPEPDFREWLIGKTDFHLCERQNLNPEIAMQRWEWYENTIASDNRTNIEETVTTPDGQKRHILRAINPVKGPDGQTLQIIGFGVDITQRKQDEEALRDSRQRLAFHVQQTPLGVIEWNLQFEVTDWNRAAEQIFGFLKQEALGRHAAGLIVPDNAKEQVNKIWEALLQQKGGERSTDENITKAGITKTCEWYNTPLVDQNGKIIGIASLVNDITEKVSAETRLKKAYDTLEELVKERTKKLETEIKSHKRTAEKLKLAKSEAESANKAKSIFLANMSHELRTPLNAIIGYSEMLQEDAEDAGQTGCVNDLLKIRTAATQLLSIISDVLDISKIEAGKMILHLETINTNDLIKEVVSTTKQLIEKNRNEFILKNNSVSLCLLSDYTKLRQCLINLLSNAAKFTQNGSVTLEVDTETKNEIEYIIFRVIDTGIGITKKQQQNLFTSFSQADTSVTKKYGGTGLGLAITKKFCQMLGGKIFVNSATDHGSTFTIKIPMTKEEVEDYIQRIETTQRI